jgi:hypothetical protein
LILYFQLAPLCSPSFQLRLLFGILSYFRLIIFSGGPYLCWFPLSYPA